MPDVSSRIMLKVRNVGDVHSTFLAAIVGEAKIEGRKGSNMAGRIEQPFAITDIWTLEDNALVARVPDVGRGCVMHLVCPVEMVCQPLGLITSTRNFRIENVMIGRRGQFINSDPLLSQLFQSLFEPLELNWDVLNNSHYLYITIYNLNDFPPREFKVVGTRQLAKPYTRWQAFRSWLGFSVKPEFETIDVTEEVPLPPCPFECRIPLRFPNN